MDMNYLVQRKINAKKAQRKKIILTVVLSAILLVLIVVGLIKVILDEKKAEENTVNKGTNVSENITPGLNGDGAGSSDENGNEGTQMQKFCYVYLPNGYDESENYNVLYLMHGGGANAGSWILEEEGNTTKNMLDTMIADGIIEPLIVVCPSFYYYNDSSKGGDTALFKYELRNNLMPAVEGKYSTYADMDTSEVGFINSRDHRGFGGFSMGSATTYQSALIGSLDYFSYFAPMHGGFISHDAVLEALTEGEFKDYEINYLLCCEGTLDSTYPQHLELYHKLLDTGKVCEGINADMLTLLYRQHNMNAWQTDLYNVLIRFF